MDMNDDALEILLVEDNPTDAELTIEALNENKLGNKLFWVRDGEQALDFLFAKGEFAAREIERRPKVVLLDLRLPKVSGMEVLRAMKSDKYTRAIPVVILTSSKEDRDVAESYDLGVNSFISKPVEFDAFARVVAQMGFYWLVVNRPPNCK